VQAEWQTKKQRIFEVYLQQAIPAFGGKKPRKTMNNEVSNASPAPHLRRGTGIPSVFHAILSLVSGILHAAIVTYC
jgi:hypothetical protein